MSLDFQLLDEFPHEMLTVRYSTDTGVGSAEGREYYIDRFDVGNM